MTDNGPSCTNSNNSDKTDANLHRSSQGEDVAKDDRMRKVLEILTESGYALPKAAVFRNAKLRGATFERRSVDNYFDEFLEIGLVKKVDGEALEEGEIVEIEPGETGYFIATDKAYEWMAENE